MREDMSYASYDLQRRLLVFWHWYVARDGTFVRQGVAFTKAGARWAARGLIRRTSTPAPNWIEPQAEAEPQRLAA
jgi:hypothetical protein